MNLLVVHNRYREPGGEDRVVELETRLLARHGHHVVTRVDDNDDIDRIARPVLALKTLWNPEAYRSVRDLIVREHINLVHVHNTLPLTSPSVIYAARAEGVPVVQTLHNYRLLCPNALCFRDSGPCTACVSRRAAVPALRHACYRRSRAATATVAALLWVHKAAGTWESKVDLFIAPSQFARAMFISAGLPARRIAVKPHFVDPDPGMGTGRGGYAVFVGRLSKEKGLDVLLDAWRHLPTQVPLWIVGDGPLAPQAAAAAAEIGGVRWLGRLPPADVQRVIGDASMLIFPSRAYETFGQVIGEAYASGTPVIVSSGGAGAEMVDPHQTGLLARPGDARDLATQVEWLHAHPERLAAMRVAARGLYESRFNAATNYAKLIDIYRDGTNQQRAA